MHVTCFPKTVPSRRIFGCPCHPPTPWPLHIVVVRVLFFSHQRTKLSCRISVAFAYVRPIDDWELHVVITERVLSLHEATQVPTQVNEARLRAPDVTGMSASEASAVVVDPTGALPSVACTRARWAPRSSEGLVCP